MKFSAALLLLVGFTFGLHAPAGAQPGNIFYWHLQINGSQVIAFSESPATIPVSIDRTVLLRLAGTLYRIADELEYAHVAEFHQAANSLSRLLVDPFKKELAACKEIVVVPDTSLLAIPIEFLQMDGTYLALLKPMSFRISTEGSRERRPLNLKSGFLLRDTSADPENGCGLVRKLFPGSVLRLTYKLAMQDLKCPAGKDFIVFSTHGLTDSAGRGCTFLNEKEKIGSGLFENRKFQLIYLDACQQGINRAYLTAIHRANPGVYFLAPLVSNDSGESSTKTMNWFFEFLKVSKDPVHSLWKTRVRLAKQYRGRNRLDRINKSLIFRIYRL